MRLAPEHDPLQRVLACTIPLLALLNWLLLELLEALGRPAPPCFLLHHLGVACPTCGGTTALAALAAGRPGEALATNPLVVVAAFALAAAGLWGVLTTFRPRWRRTLVLTPRETRLGAWTLLALVAANWIWEIHRHTL